MTNKIFIGKQNVSCFLFLNTPTILNLNIFVAVIIFNFPYVHNLVPFKYITCTSISSITSDAQATNSAIRYSVK